MKNVLTSEQILFKLFFLVSTARFLEVDDKKEKSERNFYTVKNAGKTLIGYNFCCALL
jgi:hypothetical protein